MCLPNESDESRAAFLREEIEPRLRSAALAEQRWGLPLGGELSTDDAFDEAADTVHLSEPFDDSRDTFSERGSNGLPQLAYR